MQDQVNEKVVAVSIRTTKLTVLVLQAAIKQVLVKRNRLCTEKGCDRNPAAISCVFQRARR